MMLGLSREKLKKSVKELTKKELVSQMKRLSIKKLELTDEDRNTIAVHANKLYTQHDPARVHPPILPTSP